MEYEYNDYLTFHVTTKEGSDVEMAVVDEFDFEHKHYIVGAVVKDDILDEEGRYIYRSVINGDEFTVEKIANAVDYQRVAEAYMNMEE